MADQTRRLLLRAAAFVPARTLRSSQANSAVTVGLIGAGGRGTLDAQLLVEHTGARLAAVCDLFDDRIERARARIPAPEAKVYKDYRDLLASPVDAVLIATPVFLHPEHFEAAAKAGKHIYIEKPAGADVAGCKRLMRAADSAPRRLNIAFGFQQRFAPLSRKAQQLVASGGIGRLVTAHSHWLKNEITAGEKPAPRPTSELERIRLWKNWRDTYGDFIVETYCHGIDVLNWFCGGHPLKAVASGSRTLTRRGDLRDQCSVSFTYPNEIQGSLVGTQLAPAWYRDVHEYFIGTEGVVETAREYWKHHRSRTNILEEREPRDVTIDALTEFVRRVREGKPDNTALSGAESTLTAILARTAMDLKREVSWEEMMA